MDLPRLRNYDTIEISEDFNYRKVLLPKSRNQFFLVPDVVAYREEEIFLLDIKTGIPYEYRVEQEGDASIVISHRTQVRIYAVLLILDLYYNRGIERSEIPERFVIKVSFLESPEDSFEEELTRSQLSKYYEELELIGSRYLKTLSDTKFSMTSNHNICKTCKYKLICFP